MSPQELHDAGTGRHHVRWRRPTRGAASPASRRAGPRYFGVDDDIIWDVVPTEVPATAQRHLLVNGPEEREHLADQAVQNTRKNQRQEIVRALKA